MFHMLKRVLKAWPQEAEAVSSSREASILGQVGAPGGT